MYVRPLKYNHPASRVLLDIFNLTNKSAVEDWQVTFGVPSVVQGDKPPAIPDHLNAYPLFRPKVGTLTNIVVYPTPESGWTKAQVLTYRRSIIQDHFIGVPFVLYACDYEPATILAALRDQYGLFLDEHLVDVELHPVDLEDVIFDDHLGSIVENNCGDYTPPVTYNATIRMRPEHPIWMGEIVVYIREAVKFLNRDIKTTLEVKRYLGPGDHAKMPAEMILPNNRFVDEDYYLHGLKVGDLVGEEIVRLAMKVTGDLWVFDSNPQPFNLYGAVVLYNGNNTGDFYIPAPEVTNVVIVQFSDHHCTNLAGQWIIGYYSKQKWIRRTRVDNFPLQDQ